MSLLCITSEFCPHDHSLNGVWHCHHIECLAVCIMYHGTFLGVFVELFITGSKMLKQYCHMTCYQNTSYFLLNCTRIILNGQSMAYALTLSCHYSGFPHCSFSYPLLLRHSLSIPYTFTASFSRCFHGT